MIYLYAFVDEEAANLPDLRGIGDAPLQGATRDQVTAVFSVHRQLRVRPDVASLRVHDNVVTALMGIGAVAPARFGSALTDVLQLERVLADKARWLAPVLVKLKGKWELSVRATVVHDGDDPVAENEAPPPTSGSGRAYLLGLHRDDSLRAAVTLRSSLVQLHERLAARASASTLRPGPDRSMVGAYLVAAADTETFQDDLVAARAEEPGLRISLTGPWAAYSFVDPEDLVHA